MSDSVVGSGLCHSVLECIHLHVELTWTSWPTFCAVLSEPGLASYIEIRSLFPGDIFGVRKTPRAVWPAAGRCPGWPLIAVPALQLSAFLSVPPPPPVPLVFLPDLLPSPSFMKDFLSNRFIWPSLSFPRSFLLKIYVSSYATVTISNNNNKKGEGRFHLKNDIFLAPRGSNTY